VNLNFKNNWLYIHTHTDIYSSINYIHAQNKFLTKAHFNCIVLVVFSNQKLFNSLTRTYVQCIFVSLIYLINHTQYNELTEYLKLNLRGEKAESIDHWMKSEFYLFIYLLKGKKHKYVYILL